MSNIELTESEAWLVLQALEMFLASKRTAYLQAIRGIAEPQFLPEDFGITAVMELIKKIGHADVLNERV